MYDVIPEQYKDELLAIRERTKDDSWRIGDITNAIILYAEAGKVAVPRMEVYKQVSDYCGRPARTVRYYSRIAKFYSLSGRAEFDVLSFEHFRVATGKDNWKAILDDAVSGIEIRGKPKTVEYIESKYLYNDEFVETGNVATDLIEQIENVIDELLSLISKTSVPKEGKRQAQFAVIQIRDIVREATCVKQ